MFFLSAFTIDAQVGVLPQNIKSCKEFNIKYNDSLKRNDTILTKLSIYDTLGQLVEWTNYDNNQIIFSSSKNQDGTWQSSGILNAPKKCRTVTIKTKTKDDKLVEEEYLGEDCSSGQTRYYKKIYLYKEKTDELLNLYICDKNGKLTESYCYNYDYY